MQKIDFPANEVQSLAYRDQIYTTRVSDEFSRYSQGRRVESPWGTEYVVSRRDEYDDIEDHPFYDQLTDAQIQEIRRYGRYCVLRLDAVYSRPYTAVDMLKHGYDENLVERLMSDPVHRWRAETGIELVHVEPSMAEQRRIWQNWKLMPDYMKAVSDKKSIELFGVDNTTHNRMICRPSSELPNIFKAVVGKYLELYGIDLSYMKMKVDDQPLYTDGEPCYDYEKSQCAGDWTKHGYIRINPDIKSVMRRYGVGDTTDFRFAATIVAHELAHEIWNNRSSQEFRDSILSKAEAGKFHTVYLDAVLSGKLEQETFCEYLGNVIASEIAGKTESRGYHTAPCDQSGRVYRYVYVGDNGREEGIYQAFRKAVPQCRWFEFLRSQAAKWLSRPVEAACGESWFTEAGREAFKRLTLPVLQAELDVDGIDVIEKNTSELGRILYQDEYQIVVEG